MKDPAFQAEMKQFAESSTFKTALQRSAEELEVLVPAAPMNCIASMCCCIVFTCIHCMGMYERNHVFVSVCMLLEHQEGPRADAQTAGGQQQGVVVVCRLAAIVSGRVALVVCSIVSI